MAGSDRLLSPKEVGQPAEHATWHRPLPRGQVPEDIALGTAAKSPGACAGPHQRKKQPGKRCARPEMWRRPTLGSLSYPGLPREDNGRGSGEWGGAGIRLALGWSGRGRQGMGCPWPGLRD